MTPTCVAVAFGVALALPVTGCGGGQPALPKHPEKLVPHHAKPVKKVARPSSEPKGVMLIFAQGGWLASPPAEVRTTRHYRERYTQLGWIAVDVGYRPGGQQGFTDVKRAYDKAKSEHPGLAICAVGESSGGHLALMLATVRPLDCVEPVDAPTDLTKGLPSALEKQARAVFGSDLARWSPLLHAKQIHGKVLIVQAASDPVVPAGQAKRLHSALPHSTLVLLPPGKLAFIHGTKVAKSAYQRYLVSERAWLPGSPRSRGRK